MVQTRFVSTAGRFVSLGNHHTTPRAVRSLSGWNHHVTTREHSSSSIRSDGGGQSRIKLLRELGIMTERIPPQPQHRRRSRGNNRVADELLKVSNNTIRVKSVHAAQTLDIVKVLAKVFGATSSMPPVRHMFGKTSVIVQLSPTPSDEEAQQPRFVAVYRFGSVVFFNMSARDAGKLLEDIKMHGYVLFSLFIVI